MVRDARVFQNVCISVLVELRNKDEVFALDRDSTASCICTFGGRGRLFDAEFDVWRSAKDLVAFLTAQRSLYSLQNPSLANNPRKCFRFGLLASFSTLLITIPVKSSYSLRIAFSWSPSPTLETCGRDEVADPEPVRRSCAPSSFLDVATSSSNSCARRATGKEIQPFDQMAEEKRESLLQLLTLIL